MRSALLWFIGIPIPLILLLAYCTGHLLIRARGRMRRRMMRYSTGSNDADAVGRPLQARRHKSSLGTRFLMMAQSLAWACRAVTRFAS